MSFNKDNTKKYEINDIPVILLTDQIDSNYNWFPDSFLAGTGPVHLTSTLDLNNSISSTVQAPTVPENNHLKTMSDK